MFSPFSFDLWLAFVLLKMARTNRKPSGSNPFSMVRCHMDSLTSTGESVEGETSWEYVEGEEEEEEGDD